MKDGEYFFLLAALGLFLSMVCFGKREKDQVVSSRSWLACLEPAGEVGCSQSNHVILSSQSPFHICWNVMMKCPS
jgi:hypothetical protein